MVCAPLALSSVLPPEVLAVPLLYHWYAKPTPVAETVIALRVPFWHCVCAAVDWLDIAVAALVINAPEMELVVDPQVPVTTQ